MLRPFKQATGFTLVEVLVAVTIVVGLITIVVSYLKNAQSVNAAHLARASAQSEVNQIITTLTKDLGFLNQSVAGNPSCSGASCSIVTTTDTLTYTTNCVQAPASLASTNFGSAVSAGCLPNKACAQGQIPQLTVTRPAGQATLTFPTAKLNTGVTQKPIGAMACFGLTPQAEVTLDLTYFYFDPGKLLKAVERSVTLPTTQVSGLQITQ